MVSDHYYEYMLARYRQGTPRSVCSVVGDEPMLRC